jgi:hypothetical protein
MWESIFNFVMDCIVAIANFLIVGICQFFSFLIGLIPDFCLFPELNTSSLPVTWLHAINWVLPVSLIVVFVKVWACSIVIYFTVKAFLRWL